MTDATSGRPPHAPALTLSAREWRLWLTTALAGAYLVVWLALGPAAASGAEPSASGAEPSASGAEPNASASSMRETRVVWLAEVPPEERPVFTVPAGWTTEIGARSADRAPVTRGATPVARPRRAHRVRTRSS